MYKYHYLLYYIIYIIVIAFPDLNLNYFIINILFEKITKIFYCLVYVQIPSKSNTQYSNNTVTTKIIYLYSTNRM